jgi:hypothetical protein
LSFRAKREIFPRARRMIVASVATSRGALNARPETLDAKLIFTPLPEHG